MNDRKHVGPKRTLYGNEILEAYDAADQAYITARNFGASPETVDILQRAKDLLFQARTKEGV